MGIIHLFNTLLFNSGDESNNLPHALYQPTPYVGQVEEFDFALYFPLYRFFTCPTKESNIPMYRQMHDRTDNI